MNAALQQGFYEKPEGCVEIECDLIPLVKEAWRKACVPNPEYKIDPRIFGMFSALSGGRYRIFINELIGSMPDARYLEVGTWTGSSLCSAINGNKVRAVSIDDRSEDFGRYLMHPIDAEKECMENLIKFKTAEADVSLIRQDFRKVDFSAIGKFNVYFYDGPHSEQDQFDGISLALPALDDEFVLVVDDWNHKAVKQGTFNAIGKLKLAMLHNVFVQVELGDSDLWYSQGEWHNGYLVCVLKQTKEDLTGHGITYP